MNKNLEITLCYNNIQKTINIDIYQKIGNIQEIILKYYNIIIYNIEYTEAVFIESLPKNLDYEKNITPDNLSVECPDIDPMNLPKVEGDILQIKKDLSTDISEVFCNLSQPSVSPQKIIHNSLISEGVFSKLQQPSTNSVDQYPENSMQSLLRSTESKYILGSDDLPFNNFLNIYLENDEEKKRGTLKKFIVYDRKRDELDNVIKNNYIIDRYNQWFQSNEITIENTNIIRYPINNLLHNIFNINSNRIIRSYVAPDSGQVLAEPVASLFNEENIYINQEHSLDNMINIFDNYIKNNYNMEEQEIFNNNYEEEGQNNVEQIEDTEDAEDAEDDYLDLPDLISLSYIDINLPNFFDNYQDDVIVALSNEEFNLLEKITYKKLNNLQENLNSTDFQETSYDKSISEPDGVFHNLLQSSVSPDNQESRFVNILEATGEYKNSKIINIECSICLENFIDNDKLIKLKCNHNFHHNCIKNWLCKESNKCPVCRIEVAKGNPINI
jgi:hypothetical protein